MKRVSLGLISSIIFIIVLAQVSSGSKSTTGCFGFCRKKPKKAHKTTTAEPVKVKEEKPFDPKLPNLKFIDEFDSITLEAPKGRQSMLDEPFISETDGIIIDKVTGFSRRENDPMRQGWYIRPYEEDYEHMIKVNFIPYREYYERKQQNAHKQHHGPAPVPKIPGKPKLIAINEDADLYEEVGSFLENEEMHEKIKHLLCIDPKETINASELMNEAVNSLEYHATSEDGYKLCDNDPNISISCYKKKHESHTDVLKINLNFEDPDKYNKIINRLWNPNIDNFLYKVARVYNPNLVMIQERYRDFSSDQQIYFYALATKFEISKDTTIIVMTSANINDGYPSDKEYKNTIIESANLFKTDINSEEDIRNGKLIKAFVNIAGWIIEKKDRHVNITYIESIDEHGSI
ncbi:fam-a protein [Plasmodium vinckei petteri]|uniref:Fam-a protein n=1 Tax=Plasmodium vinckei petteri TaxID=138298 RepID=A0A6V7TD84_PLAVN|nr:fam-a protein [Plasmodium vinckei petteri]